jgi:signal transduction histidine kinase
LGLGPEERSDLLAIRPLLEQHADALVAAFYRHLLAFDRTRELLRDPEVKRRLLEKQRTYLVSLGDGQYDEDFIAERVAIGETHERIGLEPRWYLGAYALYFSLLAPLVTQAYRTEPDRAERTLSALVMQLLLDAQLAMEAYGARSRRELEYLNRELAASGQSLAREFEERGVELRHTERRARAAEDLASAATLVAGLAHEIGTPMSVIQGHAELLESSVNDEGGHARLRTIREQIARISRIIQTLLTAARPHEVVRVPLPLEPILETSLSFLEDEFRQRRIEIERRFEQAPQIRGDGEKLQQLFLNLLLNAADAMPEGGSIVVTLGTGADGGAEIRIRDTGTGISDQALARIFDPFFTTKAAGHGSGLGLVVARQIVLDHDGEIDVESEAGTGTEFRIVFPPIARGRR